MRVVEALAVVCEGCKGVGVGAGRRMASGACLTNPLATASLFSSAAFSWKFLAACIRVCVCVCVRVCVCACVCDNAMRLNL